MPSSKRSLSQLPLLDDTWLIGTSRLQTWAKEGDNPPTRPYLILIASSNTGLICGSNLVPEAPSAAQVGDVLFNAMQHPPRELGKACRPRSIALADTALLEPLQILLKDAGLDTEVFVAGFPDEFYEIIHQMEGMISRVAGDLGSPSNDRDSALARTQQVMYRASEENSPARRITLAHESLSLSEDCADAYVLLAEEEADSVKRTLELYKQGMDAGARALGTKYFEENAGDFWGLPETRPYRRARQGLAETLWRLKRYEEAIEHYHELLRLNPGDNQGNRYALLDLLIQFEHYKEALDLLDQYRDEWFAVWLYSRALLEFQGNGASAAAKRILRQAIEENRFVPAYLTSQKRVPNRRVDYYGWGTRLRQSIMRAST